MLNIKNYQKLNVRASCKSLVNGVLVIPANPGSGSGAGAGIQ